jgi:two-component system response regulator AtoC
MREGRFREDLYFRLNVFHLELPPLRERPQDVPALASAFLAEVARDLGRPAPRLDAQATALLQGYAWRGNVRELRNVMERAAVLSHDASVSAALVASLLPAGTAPARVDVNLERALADLERRLILDALLATDDNKSAAAKLLGIGERTLWTKLKKHDI